MKVNSLLLSNQKEDSIIKYLDNYLKGKLVHIYSNQAFLNLLEQKQLDEFDYCFILVELKWNKRVYIQHYGFDVAKQLRQNNYTGIIFFLSVFSKDNFPPKLSRYTLLRVQEFHHFFHLPHLPQVLPPPKKMSVELLEDIQSTLIGVRPLVRELMHDLKNAVTIKDDIDPDQRLELIEEAIKNKFADLQGLLATKQEELATIINSLLPAIRKAVKTKENVQEIVEKHSLEVLSLTPKPSVEDAINVHPQTKWKVLFVDDDANIREYLAEGLERNNIDFLAAKNSSEVLAYLEEDRSKNQICLLACDLRLKDETTEIWDKLQGYDLIRTIYQNDPNFVSFFALTSAKSRLFRLKKNYKINVRGYYKNDVLSSMGALNIFAEKLREVGDNTFFQSRSQPVSTAWWKSKSRFFKPLAAFYKDHILSLNYEFAERQINELAYNFIQNIKNNLANDKLEFTITIKNSDDEEESLEKFRNHILLGRRIAIGLFLNDYSEEDIFDYMQPNSESKNKDASKKFLFNTSLALSLKKDLPQSEDINQGIYLRSKLLLEEIQWAIRSLGVNFDLDQLRLNMEDWNALSQILENLQSRLNNITKEAEDIDVRRFQKVRFNKQLRANNIKKYFQLAFELAGTYGIKQSLIDDIQLDLPEIKNHSIRMQITEILDNYTY